MDSYTEMIIQNMERYIESCKFTFMSTENIVVSKSKIQSFLEDLKGNQGRYPGEEGNKLEEDIQEQGAMHKILKSMDLNKDD